MSKVIEKISKLLKVEFLSTEGVVIDDCAFAEDVISFIVIRNPIDRIFSLYWYEHVDFYYNLKREPSKTKQFKVWMDAWLDGSGWKRGISEKYGYENYVEIENYYVKMLISWRGNENRAIDTNDYLKACSVLERHFDVIFVTEWLEYKNQSLFLDRIVPNISKFMVPEVVGKANLKKKLMSTLIGDTTSIITLKRILEERNLYDVMLWNYAQQLVRERIAFLSDMKFSVSLNEYRFCEQRSSINLTSCRDSKKIFGLFQTTGHKGPF